MGAGLPFRAPAGEDAGKLVVRAQDALELGASQSALPLAAGVALLAAAVELYTQDADRFAERSSAEPAVAAEQRAPEAQPDVELQPEAAVLQMPRSEVLQASRQEEARWRPVARLPQEDAAARPLAEQPALEVEQVSRQAERLQPDAAARLAVPLAEEEQELERLVSQLLEA